MITKYKKYNENVPYFNPGDKVVGHGTIETWHPGVDDYVRIDIDGQTGTIHCVQYSFAGVMFDNFFTPFLFDLHRRLKLETGLMVRTSQLEKIDINISNEYTPVIFSEDAKKVLEYAEYLHFPVYSNMNYVDVGSNQNTITYLSNDRLKRLNENDNPWSSNLRQEVRIGRFLQSINPYTSKVSLDKKINIYKSSYNSIILNKYTFTEVRGYDITYWYNELNYQEGSGTLNHSCMKDKLYKLKIYEVNPEKISMLIMVNDDGKLLGRALIWKVDEPKITYMDRVYTVYEEDVIAFHQYAKRRSWEFVNNQKMIIYMKDDYGDASNNPYMDTFNVFCLEGENGENYLTNRFTGCEEYYEYDDAG